jgi:hypothetical protein
MTTSDQFNNSLVKNYAQELLQITANYNVFSTFPRFAAGRMTMDKESPHKRIGQEHHFMSSCQRLKSKEEAVEIVSKLRRCIRMENVSNS